MVCRGTESRGNGVLRRRGSDFDARKGDVDDMDADGEDGDVDEVAEGRGARVSSPPLLALAAAEVLGLALFPRYDFGFTKGSLLLLLLPGVLLIDSWMDIRWAFSRRIAAPIDEEEYWLSLTAGCRLYDGGWSEELSAVTTLSGVVGEAAEEKEDDGVSE